MAHRRQKRSRTKAKETGEHRAVEALTVGWMLTVLTAMVCEVGSLAASRCARVYFDAG